MAAQTAFTRRSRKLACGPPDAIPFGMPMGDYAVLVIYAGAVNTRFYTTLNLFAQFLRRHPNCSIEVNQYNILVWEDALHLNMLYTCVNALPTNFAHYACPCCVGVSFMSIPFCWMARIYSGPYQPHDIFDTITFANVGDMSSFLYQHFSMETVDAFLHNTAYWGPCSGHYLLSQSVTFTAASDPTAIGILSSQQITSREQMIVRITQRMSTPLRLSNSAFDAMMALIRPAYRA